MPFGLFQYIIMRSGLVFVIVRLHVVFAHWMILKALPHQQAAESGMPIENNALEIENLTFLKLRAAPNVSERRYVHFVAAILRTQANDERAMFQLHRIEMINRFEKAGDLLVRGFLDFLLHTIHELLDLSFDLLNTVGPINACDIRDVIEPEFRAIAQPLRGGESVFVV